MRYKYFLFLLNFLLLCFTAHCQKTAEIDPMEEKCIQVINGFNDFIKHSIQTNANITKDSSVKYILLNYLFVNRSLDSVDLNSLDSNLLSMEKQEILRREINDYLRFFAENGDKTFIENIGILPIRLSSEKFIYDHLTKFQKTNTFILFDKRKPDNILTYLLIIPPIKNRLTEPRIWSWTLGFKFGKFYFSSPIGEVGYEYIFP